MKWSVTILASAIKRQLELSNACKLGRDGGDLGTFEGSGCTLQKEVAEIASLDFDWEGSDLESTGGVLDDGRVEGDYRSRDDTMAVLTGLDG